MEERGGPSYVPGTSAAALIQFPTPPNLEAELQSFASGFASLQNSTGAEHMKRSVDDEIGHGRSVRGNTRLPTRRPSVPTHPVANRPSSLETTKGGGGSSEGVAVSGNGGGGGGSGFDWLVVYNPKAARSISIDLMHTLVHENVVCCVRFSHDGRYLATGSNRIATLFDVKTGERVAAFVDVEGVAQDGDQYVRSVAFSPDGRLLVTGSEDQIVRVWSVAEQKLLCRLTGHTQDIYSADFMPNGREVISGSGDRTVRIWDVEGSGTLKTTFTIGNIEQGRDGGITSVAVSPNGKYVVAGSLDRTIRLWDVESGQALETLEGHRDSVYSVAFAPDGRHLISGSLDKTIKVWQFDSAETISRGICKYTILGHKDFVLSVAGAPPDGRWIVSGSKDRSVQFWDSQSGTTQLMLQGHKNSVISVAISPTGACFATGSGDCRARIWSYANFATTATIVAPTAPASSSTASTTSTSSLSHPEA